LASLFGVQRSDYLYGVEGLDAALVQNLGADERMPKRSRFSRRSRGPWPRSWKPRKEFFDKIWYVRKLILQEKIELGEEKPLGATMEEL
jgi:hypothetical protein